MDNRLQHSQLCRLIDESLRPFTHLQVELADCLTKESEKDLLIVLSQVFRLLQMWKQDFNNDSANGMAVKVPACKGPGCEVPGDDHDCLTSIIGYLIQLLPIKSQYVQHLAGNILVEISDYMVESGSNWDEYTKSLCICAELGIRSALLHSLEHPTMKDLVSKCYPSRVIVALKPKLNNANWSSVAGVIQVLRIILKHLKDSDDQLLDMYFDAISSCLANVPWDLVNELRVCQNGETVRFSSPDIFPYKAGQLEPRIVFHGTLVQFLCSLVNQNCWMEASGGSFNNHPVICQISNLIPSILSWCRGDRKNLCMSEYFGHKILMLMVRLSFQIQLECSLLVSWLQLVHEYFEDLLLLPMTQLDSDQDDCLEGSPFLETDGRVHDKASSHLQRLAIFLFLRCSFSLLGLSGKAAGRCGCSYPTTCMYSDLNSGPKCCSRKKGLLELYGWLQGQLPAETFSGCEFYFERCISFTLSFLRLFIHEDDVLFQVLLQLLNVPTCATRRVCEERDAFQEMNIDILFHISNVFNPIHLFHLFLAELHYDHEVLLDYLISKVTGASSAEYLLRSLRVVCESWNIFVQFSVEGVATNTRDIHKLSNRKRKVPEDGSDFQGHLIFSSLKSNGIPLSLRIQCLKDNVYRKHCRTRRPAFEDAKDCLLSLKKSVQNLHLKHLFPYNPEVLLRSLTRFRELCL